MLFSYMWKKGVLNLFSHEGNLAKSGLVHTEA